MTQNSSWPIISSILASSKKPWHSKLIWIQRVFYTVWFPMSWKIRDRKEHLLIHFCPINLKHLLIPNCNPFTFTTLKVLLPWFKSHFAHDMQTFICVQRNRTALPSKSLRFQHVHAFTSLFNGHLTLIENLHVHKEKWKFKGQVNK